MKTIFLLITLCLSAGSSRTRAKWEVLLAVLLFALPLSGWAQFAYTTNKEAITITGYTGPGGNVTIPSATNGYPVTTIGTNAFYNKAALTGVIIPYSVISIDDQAFYFSGLTNVTIPDSVTSIGQDAFFGCSRLMNVAIGISVTSIGDSAFGECSSLTNIVVNAANPSYASRYGVWFNKALTSLIQFPEGLSGSYSIPVSVTNIADFAFFGCSRLMNVAIPDSLSNIGHEVFANCSGLASVTIPDSVINIQNGAFTRPVLAFDKCDAF